MDAVLQVSTTKYDQEIETIRLAMNNLSALCRVSDAFKLSQPENKFGWTFFKILITNSLYVGIEEKFADMIQKYKGHKPEEKFVKFLTDFFESRGATVKLKLEKV